MFIRAKSGKNNSVIYFDEKGNRLIRSGGSRAWRNNNPGNIRPGGSSKWSNAIGSAGGFSIFSDYKSGRKAMKTLLKSKRYFHLSISEAIVKYAPPKENDTKRYKRLIRSISGLNIDRKLRDLNNSEFEKLMDTIQRIEGYKIGIEKKVPVEKVIDVKKNKKGVITNYLIKGKGWVSKSKAIWLAKNGELDAVVVRHGNGKYFIRSRPDGQILNNFSVL